MSCPPPPSFFIHPLGLPLVELGLFDLYHLAILPLEVAVQLNRLAIGHQDVEVGDGVVITVLGVNKEFLGNSLLFSSPLEMMFSVFYAHVNIRLN